MQQDVVAIWAKTEGQGQALVAYVGCVSDWWSGSLELDPRGFSNILSLRFIMKYSLPSADSRRAVVSFWQKNVHKYWLTA